LARKSTDVVQLKLRFQEQLRRALEREARKAGHSLNREIVRRLIHSFQQQSQHEVVTAAIKQAAQETVRETLQQLRPKPFVDTDTVHAASIGGGSPPDILEGDQE
jgi:carbonic anhydrase